MPVTPREPLPAEIAAAIARTSEVSAWLVQHMPGEISYSGRAAIAMAYFGLAIDHHVSIALLIEQGRYSSAYALLRPVYECAMRGYWVAFVAKDKEIEQLRHHVPKFDRVMRGLNRGSPNFAQGQFAKVHELGWESFCDYTHGGARQLSRWLAGDDIGPAHVPEEVAGVLRMADHLAMLAAGGAIQLAGGELSTLHEFMTREAR